MLTDKENFLHFAVESNCALRNPKINHEAHEGPRKGGGKTGAPGNFHGGFQGPRRLCKLAGETAPDLETSSAVGGTLRCGFVKIRVLRG
jgi:hypothetical protein